MRTAETEKGKKTKKKEEYLFVGVFRENSADLTINLLFNVTRQVIRRCWREQLFPNNYFGEDNTIISEEQRQTKVRDTYSIVRWN